MREVGGRGREGWWVWSTAAKAGGDDGFVLAFHREGRDDGVQSKIVRKIPAPSASVAIGIG